MSAMSRRLLVLLACFAALWSAAAVGGCGSQDSGGAPPAARGGGDDGGGVTPPPPTNQPKLTLADVGVVTALGQGVAVTATALDANNQPVNGVSVSFTVTPPSGVAAVVPAAPATVVTANGGKAAAEVFGLAPGSATVKATATVAGTSVSATKTVSVQAPLVTVSAAPTTISVGTALADGSVVTATVTDRAAPPNPIENVTVKFETTLGTIGPVEAVTDAAGAAAATLTSTRTGTADVTAAVFGVKSAAQQITVQAGTPATVTLTPSPSRIFPGGQSTLTLRVLDAFQNPVNATVAVATSDGQLSAPGGLVTVTGGNGEVALSATSVGTAQLSASIGGVVLATAQVVTEQDFTGQPANVLVDVEPQIISIENVGGTELATITVRVLDLFGNAIGSVSNNVELTMIDGPGGGENLNGKLIGQPLTVSTTNGVATANLQSGSRPGTVRLEIKVTKDKNGVPLVTPVTAVVPDITIQSGAPFSVFLTRSNAVTSSTGTITHEYLAFVYDRFGNPVPDGTAVYFGQIGNIVHQCRNWRVFDPDIPAFVDETCDPGGSTAAGTPTFTANGLPPGLVEEGDTLAVISEDNPHGLGGFVLDAVAGTTLTVDGAFQETVHGLEYAVGNNRVGGVILPGARATTTGGVARWPNTYPGDLVNIPVYIYAETEGRVLGHARFYNLTWVAPTKVGLRGAPTEARPGDVFALSFSVEDSSSPTPYRVPDLATQVSVTNGTLEVFPDPDYDGMNLSPKSLYLETTSRVRNRNYPGGDAAFIWRIPPALCPDANPCETVVVGDKVKLTIGAAEVVSEITVTIK